MVGTAMEKIATALAVIECLGEALDLKKLFGTKKALFGHQTPKMKSSEFMTHVDTFWLFDVVCFYPF